MDVAIQDMNDEIQTYVTRIAQEESHQHAKEDSFQAISDQGGEIGKSAAFILVLSGNFYLSLLKFWPHYYKAHFYISKCQDKKAENNHNIKNPFLLNIETNLKKLSVAILAKCLIEIMTNYCDFLIL